MRGPASPAIMLGMGTRRRWRTVSRLAAAAAVATTIAGCGQPQAETSAEGFEQAMQSGASCSELFDIRNELDPGSPLVEEYNVTLRSIGCYSSSSERTDVADESREPYAITAEPSIGCLDAMAVAADETDPSAADPLIVATLSACQTSDEWLAALREHPGALGLTDGAVGTNRESDDLSLQVVCYANADTPVCQDAADAGRVP